MKESDEFQKIENLLKNKINFNFRREQAETDNQFIFTKIKDSNKANSTENELKLSSYVNLHTNKTENQVNDNKHYFGLAHNMIKYYNKDEINKLFPKKNIVHSPKSIFDNKTLLSINRTSTENNFNTPIKIEIKDKIEPIHKKQNTSVFNTKSNKYIHNFITLEELKKNKSTSNMISNMTPNETRYHSKFMSNQSNNKIFNNTQVINKQKDKIKNKKSLIGTNNDIKEKLDIGIIDVKSKESVYDEFVSFLNTDLNSEKDKRQREVEVEKDYVPQTSIIETKRENNKKHIKSLSYLKISEEDQSLCKMIDFIQELKGAGLK